MNDLIFEQTLTDLNTISDFVRFGMTLFEQSGCFYGHGTNNALDDAAAILCGVLALDPEHIATFKDAKLCKEEKHKIIELYKKRVIDKIPAVYLTNKTWFAQLPFYVDQRVIIPRSPLAEVVEAAYSPWFKQDDIQRILDLCTGSGCIAIASAYYCPNASVDAVDIDEQALEVAKKNVNTYQMQDRIRLIQSDLFAALTGHTYDIIISNPPYVDYTTRGELPKEYLHEPERALFAKDQGIYFASRILEASISFLNPGGMLFVEVGDASDAMQQRFANIPFVWLNFNRGGGGVFQLDYDALITNEKYIRKVNNLQRK